MAYSSRRLTRLVQDTHTGEVIDLEKRVAEAAVADTDSQFAQLITRALDAWTRTFGGADQPGSAGEGLRRILDAVHSAVLHTLDALAPRATNATERALGGALELGARQGDAFLHAASGQRHSTPTPRISAALRDGAHRIGNLVSQHRDRALFLLHPARVTRWTHLLAGLGAARSAASTVRAHISWVINTAVNEGLDAAIRAAAPLRLWVAEADACVRCLAYTGRTTPVGEPFPGGLSWDPRQRRVRTPSVDGPPLHPHCFAAGTVASGPGVRAATDRWYEGEMVEVRTRGGRVLTVTPNHPVLTSHGWVAAGLLHKGSQLVSDWALESMLRRDPDDYQEPTAIEEIAGTLRGPGGVTTVRMPVSAEDFHGDGTDGQVDVVWTDGLLWSWPEILEPFGEQQLCRAHAGLVALTGRRYPGSMLDRLWTPSDGGLGCPGVGAMFLRTPAVSEEAVRGSQPSNIDAFLRQQPLDDSASYARAVRNALDALAALVALDEVGDGLDNTDADLDTVAAQEVVHRLATDPVVRREGTKTLAAAVALDEVVGVCRFPWSGHVYNLETSGGWYIANGIVVHNCRCRTVPWSDGWTTSGTPFPLALRREAHRSLAYGRARPFESRAVRLRAARELLRTVDDLLPAVEERARTAIRASRFPATA